MTQSLYTNVCAISCPTQNTYERNARSVYKNFIEFGDFAHRPKSSRACRIDTRTMGKSCAVGQGSLQRTPLQCTLVGYPLCVIKQSVRIFIRASYAPKETYNKVQTYSIIRTIEETHYYETV